MARSEERNVYTSMAIRTGLEGKLHTSAALFLRGHRYMMGHMATMLQLKCTRCSHRVQNHSHSNYIDSHFIVCFVYFAGSLGFVRPSQWTFMKGYWSAGLGSCAIPTNGEQAAEKSERSTFLMALIKSPEKRNCLLRILFAYVPHIQTHFNNVYFLSLVTFSLPGIL